MTDSGGDALEVAPEGAEAQREGLRKLRERAKLAHQLEQENAQLRADLAFRDLGLTDRQREAVLAVHDGPVDAESLRVTAEELSFLHPPQVSAEEILALERQQEAMTGAEAADAHTESLDDLIARTRSPEELQAVLSNAGFTHYE